MTIKLNIRRNGRRSTRLRARSAAPARRCLVGSCRPSETKGLRGGPTTEDSAKIKALERENRELRQANESLRKAWAYFAQAELDRPFKR